MRIVVPSVYQTPTELKGPHSYIQHKPYLITKKWLEMGGVNHDIDMASLIIAPIVESTLNVTSTPGFHSCTVRPCATTYNHASLATLKVTGKLGLMSSLYGSRSAMEGLVKEGHHGRSC